MEHEPQGRTRLRGIMRMNSRVNITCIVLCAAVMSSSATLYAADDILASMTVQQRLERVERLLSAEVLQQQSAVVDAIKQEVALLREQLEQQEYELETLKQRQRSLYLDMDRRLSSLESGSARGSSIPPPVPPPQTGTTSAPDTVVASPATDVDGKDDYDKAYTLLKEGRYKPAIDAFVTFLQKYPNSKYADNAQYWLGEANYVLREYKTALEEFQKLIARFPDSSKISGARLKIGYVYFELKNWSAARESLQQVIKLYPDTSVAKKADERLDRIAREGN